MAVPSTAADLSTTAASNSPAGSDSIGTSLDDYLRALGAIIKQENSKGADTASANSVTIPSQGSYFVITGTTTITSFADSWVGRTVFLKFSDALTLTNSAGLILPAGANITTAAGDVFAFTNESTGVWRCDFYQPAVGYQKIDAELTALAGLTSAADKVPMFSGSGTATLLDFKDEDDMASDSATAVPSQQSVKAYVTSALSINMGTSVASTSGTTIDFTGLTGAKRITLTLAGVSTNGTSALLFQLGDAGGIEPTGYLGSCGVIDGAYVGAAGRDNPTTGIGLTYSRYAATDVLHGAITATLIDAASFTWAVTGLIGSSGPIYLTAGKKALSAALTQVRLTTVNGTDAFDAGLINIAWET